MKLKSFEYQGAYRFLLAFENGEMIEADLQGLIGQHIGSDSLQSAHIDADWGCLEFLDGQVDIEPKTLYHYVHDTQDKRAA
jgi:hypothetical protein